MLKMNTTKISQVLKETTISQIKGSLIIFNNNKEMAGKCALGVLACEDGNEKHKLSFTSSSRNITHDILNEYDIPEDIRGLVPSIRSGYSDGSLPDNEKSVNIDYDRDTTLTYEIMVLNDTFGLDFKQIAEWLEITYDL